jgi:hypothetical protein
MAATCRNYADLNFSNTDKQTNKKGHHGQQNKNCLLEKLK